LTIKVRSKVLLSAFWVGCSRQGLPQQFDGSAAVVGLL